MKKIFYIVFSLCLSLSFISLHSNSANAQGFNDVTRYQTFINYLVGKDIIHGYKDGTFKPTNDVSRLQAVQMILNEKGVTLGDAPDPHFKDIHPGDYGYEYAAKSAQLGIIKGKPDGTFDPAGTLSRGQMASILVNAYDLKGTQNTFSDVPDYLKAAVSAIKDNGITRGYPDGTYKPSEKMTREHFAVFLAKTINPDFRDKPDLKVNFIDVGQGDSIFVQFPNGKNMLVDGGKSSAGDKVVSYIKSLGVNTIDLLVGTHPDADHIGGLPDVINNFTVKKVLDSGKDHTTQTYTDYLALIDQKNIPFDVATSGEYLSLDSNVTVRVLNSGDSAPTDETNDSSIVLKVSYGNEDVLLTGDAPIDVEEEMMQKYDVSAEILKVGHHGSDTSTSQAFVNAVNPGASILSYGVNNYGHPNAGVVDRLRAAGSKVYSTYESGDIVATISPTAYQVSATPWTGTGNDGGGTGDTGSNTGNLDITALSLDGEYVIIKNNGSTSIDLTGWSLVSTDGNQTFNFPDGYTLGSGQSVKVVSGNGATANPPSQLLWSTAYIWNNNGDNAELFSADGTLVDSE